MEQQGAELVRGDTATAPGGNRVPLSPLELRREARSATSEAGNSLCAHGGSHFPGSQGVSGREFAMRIYYRGPDVVVTSELFVVRRGSPPGRFAIHDLRDVCIAPGRTEGVRLSVVVPPAAAAALVAAAAVSAAGGVLIGVAIAVSAAGAGIACAVVQQHRPRRWELRATYRER